jgi:N-dimethylarginine dimethylaminohydrolase
MSLVEVSPTGLGYRSVRVAGLPPEVKDTVLSSTMMKYGDVQTITDGQWARYYRYYVSNGVRLVQINLKKHIPSQIYIAGTKTYYVRRSN